MVYVRGAKSDYDGWAGLGNNGWSFNDLLPLIKRVNILMSLHSKIIHDQQCVA
jgi:choline dehydrogenase-like flavoprotein